MKNLKWKDIIYILVGIFLLVMTIITGTKGLSDTDKDIYAKAMELQKDVKGLGFTGFDVNKFKVRFFDGESDYVVKGDEIAKEKPVIETFVGTTVEVDGEFQVLLPTYDRFSQMFTALAAAGNMAAGEFTFDEAEYSTNAHIATLWHEGFHTWQFQSGFDAINEQAMSAGLTEGTSYAEILLKEVDSNETLVAMFEQEMELLKQIIDAEDKNPLLQELLLLREERKAMLSTEAAFIERYYEAVEGSARYVEASIYRELEGQEAWAETYMAPFIYQNGSGKYYEMGMLKCMILDQIAPDWKESFDVTTDLDVLLEKAFGRRQSLIDKYDLTPPV